MPSSSKSDYLTVVTGASGHVGGNLVRMLLARGRRVRAVVKTDFRALEGLGVETVTTDVTEPASLEKALSGADVVYHLAARISLWGEEGGVVNEVNVEGPKNVVAACLKLGVRRLVHFSSIHAFRQQPLKEQLNESRECSGEEALAYDRSKARGERIVLDSVKQGLDAVVVNPTSIIGPYDFKPSPMGEVIHSLMEGRIPALVAGGFDWVDVRDVCAGAIAAEERGRTGEKYLLSGTYCQLGELAKLIEGATGSKAPGFICPIWLAKIGAPFSSAWARLAKRRPLYTMESLEILERSNNLICCDKARHELGYSPRPLQVTIGDTCAWFQAADKAAASKEYRT